MSHKIEQLHQTLPNFQYDGVKLFTLGAASFSISINGILADAEFIL